ncbi:toll-like receptor 4 [Babylonia areolata]|uniref:toll-like receptor 4 n=1 Tax=Babylonia areolata TaxID=304850 RepID=UPI003FD517D2
MLQMPSQTTKVNLMILVMTVVLPLALGVGETAAVRKENFQCWSVPVKPYLLTHPCYTVDQHVLCRCSNTTLDCSSNSGRLNYIPNVFRGAQVLNFSYNELHRLQNEDFFHNVSMSLRVLDLFNNDMTFITPTAFRHLHKLKVVLIGGNNLSYEQLKPVFSIPTVNVVKVMCGNLGAIPLDYFNKTHSLNLEVLNLSWNNIRTLDMHTLQPLQKLWKFHLWSNELSSLHTDSLPFLEDLGLHKNRLYEFPATCKDGTMNESLFPKLRSLDLSKNPISSIPDPVCLPRLVHLDLSYTVILSFSAKLFSASRFPVLKQLFLNQMESKIKEINAYAFNNSGLQMLGIGYNLLDFSINEVSEDMLAGCVGLTQLYLTNNNFKKVSKDKLHRLLRPVHNLEVLYMAVLQIDSISSDTFINLPRLTSLFLYGNLLFSLPDGAFDHLPRLQYLSLNSNHISKITSYTFSLQTQQRLVFMDLSNNPFQCGCELLWFQQWMRERPGLFADFEHLGYRCDNLHNRTVPNFHISQQACIWGTSTYILIISFISFFILIFLLFIAIFGYRWHIRLWLYAFCRGQHERSRRQAQRQLRGFRYDVFVSYAEEDRDWVHDELLPVLEQQWGLRVCVHERDFLPGKHIMENISDSMEASDRFIMVFSPHFAGSQWCQFEVKMCQSVVMERDDVMIVVMLQETGCRALTTTMMAILHTTTYLRWTDQDSARASFWGRLRLALGDLLPH